MDFLLQLKITHLPFKLQIHPESYPKRLESKLQSTKFKIRFFFLSLLVFFLMLYKLGKNFEA